MSDESFLSNGFAFDVFAIVTRSTIVAETCFVEERKLWTTVPVGNVVGVAPTVEGLHRCSSVHSSLVPEDGTMAGEDSAEESIVATEGGFLSACYLNLDKGMVKLRDNVVVRKGGIYIVTLSGDIKESSSNADAAADHWSDVEGVSHKPLPCDSCQRCRSIESSLTSCSSCFYVSNISTLQSAMRCILDVGVSNMLIQLANDLYLEPAREGFEHAKEIREKLKEKAKQYAVIESEARRFVAMTKEYGGRVEEAYQDYEEDENIEDFVTAAENTSGLRRKFEEVTNRHAEMIAEVKILKDEADEGRREMNQRAADVNDREIFQQGAALTGTTTIGSTLVAAGVRNVSNAPALARVVGVVGRGGVIGLAMAGSAVVISLLGYGGYKLYEKLKSEAKTNFANLAMSFEIISQGIENVSRHLVLIEDSLRNIETKWRQIVDEDGKVVGGEKVKRSLSKEQFEGESGTDGMSKKERRLAANVVKKARELMGACEGYEKRTNGSSFSLRWN